MRLELDLESLEGFHVGQRVKADKPGVKIGKIKRFSEAAGRYFADVEFQIAAMKFLKMISVEKLSPIRQDIELSRRRSEAGSLGM